MACLYRVVATSPAGPVLTGPCTCPNGAQSFVVHVVTNYRRLLLYISYDKNKFINHFQVFSCTSQPHAQPKHNYQCGNEGSSLTQKTLSKTEILFSWNSQFICLA